MSDAINNTQDIIDSRDIIARIEELEEDREACADGIEELTAEQWDDEHGEELDALKSLAAEAEGYAPDWHYGEALIRETYFEEYARELAHDIGAVNEDAGWPGRHIDWEAAAVELKHDYTAVEFDGVTYYIR